MSGCACGWGKDCPICPREKLVKVPPYWRTVRTAHLPPPPNFNGLIDLVVRIVRPTGGSKPNPA